MEGTMSEIRGFAGSFVPRNWAYCDGQLMDISQNNALFALLGTNFGGDGRITFGLPDLRGRVLVHMGAYPGGETRLFSEVGGIERVKLNISQMPKHTHLATTQGGTGTLTGSITAEMHVNDSSGGNSAPKDKFLGYEGAESGFYADAASGTDILSTDAITVKTDTLGVDVTGIQVGIGDAGGDGYHTNMQPYLVVSWIICIQGAFPSRN
jgi:microcystin-dependent protein